jgi:hypothetical protein
MLLGRRYYGSNLEEYVILILLNLDGKCKWTTAWMKMQGTLDMIGWTDKKRRQIRSHHTVK